MYFRILKIKILLSFLIDDFVYFRIIPIINLFRKFLFFSYNILPCIMFKRYVGILELYVHCRIIFN